MRLRRPDFTPIFSGRHKRAKSFVGWPLIEVAILVVLALFVWWAFHQRTWF